MRSGFPTILALLGSLATGFPLHGQVLPEQVQSPLVATVADPRVDTVARREDAGGAVLGALVFGAIGWVVGWHSGNLDGLLWSESVGIALGAHIGNGGRGNPLAPLLASVGVMLAARVAARHEEVDSPTFALMVPMLQIALAVAAETSTGRRRARR
jgi:hypothetical protein